MANFNSEMEAYLSKVKKPQEPKKEKKKRVNEEEKMAESKEFKEEEKEYYTERKTVFQKFLDFVAGPDDDEEPITGKEEAIAEKQEEVEDEKELEKYSKKPAKSGILSSLKVWFSSDDDNSNNASKSEEKHDTSAISEDLKEVIKIQNKWLMKLPVKTIKEFKDSEDYKVYKDTLKRYNLIKVKE